MESDYYRVARAIRYLVSNATQQPSLEELASQLALSPSHCQRMFKRWAGISPKRFLQLLTVEHSKRLLEQHTTLDTAYAAGLSSASRLHDHFVSIEAITPGQYKQCGEKLHIRHGVYPSVFGWVWLALSDKGICGLQFLPDNKSEIDIDKALKRWPAAVIERDDKSLVSTIEKIFEVPSKQTQRWPLLVQGTNFQVQIWKALLGIPLSQLASYQHIAAAINHPQAARAVANAVGANPVAFLIPCHRVLRSSGALGGYRWGIERKQAMLAWEAALLESHE